MTKNDVIEHIESHDDKDKMSHHNVAGAGHHHDKALDLLGDERVVMTDEQVRFLPS